MMMMATLSKPSFLLVLLGLCKVVHSAPLHIVFTFLSKYNNFPELVTMFTLCLAPLVTHVAFGLAKTVITVGKGPRWTDRVTDFNPISITWRYNAIAYRRVRAKKWDVADLAACNAHFWDGERWDGSEYMMIKSRDFLTHGPEKPHVHLISGSSVATLALVLQGAQAFYFLVSVATPTGTPTSLFNPVLPALFMPIGILGVLRLPAAGWITDDYGYNFEGDHPPLLHAVNTTESRQDDRKQAIKHRLLDTGNWKCICYRIWWILSISAIMGLGFWDVAASFSIVNPDTGIIFMSLTFFLYLITYLQLTCGMLAIHLFYVLRSEHVSTVIPCSQQTWYKAVTFIMMATAFTAVLVAALETVRLPNGDYITSPLFGCTENNVCDVAFNQTRYLEYVDSEWLAFLQKPGVVVSPSEVYLIGPGE